MFSQLRKSPLQKTDPGAVTGTAIRVGVAVVVLVLPVGSAAASPARPAPDAGAAPAVSAPRVAHDALLPYCFMGRHNWPTAAIGPQPRCEV
jgi:hypothetical protein